MMRAMAFAVGAVLAAIGCDSSPRHITAADIVPIGPGSGTGSLFSGDYIITGGVLQGCSCRVGNCATVHVLIGAAITVSQTDGTLQLEISGSPGVCTGAVDSDGQYRCNGQVVDLGDVEYTLTTGRIQTANGQPTFLTQTSEATATIQAGAIDCDIKGTVTAQYSGPTAAFAAGDLSARATGFSLFGR
jgi:hypothetical protein